MNKDVDKSSRARIAGIAVGLLTVAALLAWGVGDFLARDSGSATVSVPPSEPTLRLMSQSQYTNTLTQIFGPDIEIRARFAPVTRADGLLGVGASRVELTPGAVEPLEATARAVAEQVVSPQRREYLIPCTPRDAGAADKQCAETFLSEIGRLLYRRSMTDKELSAAVGQASEAAGIHGNFYDGLAYALAGILSSPQFLFIWEAIEPDPTSPGNWRLDGYSKASRLSFLLWDTAPDDELLQVAERGGLHDVKELRRQLDRMIASPLYREGVRAFFDDFFVMEKFDTLTKDPTIYPAFTLKVAAEAREQLLRTIVDHLVDRGEDYRDLYTTRRTFLSSDLAVLHGLGVNLGSQGWVAHEFEEGDPRAGILTHVGFLAQYSHEGRSSATQRGRAVREVALCQKVPDPPPSVDFSNFEGPQGGATARERLNIHNENPTCAGCHAVTDPVGIGLENFDGAGQFRLTDNGVPIDPSDQLDGIHFEDALGVGHAVRENPALTSCLLNRLYAYSMGRPISREERPLMDAYEAKLAAQGYHFDDILRLIVLGDSFFRVKPPQESGPAPVNVAAVGGSHVDQNPR